MRKFFLLLFTATGIAGANAQNIYPEFDNVPQRDAPRIVPGVPNDFWSRFCMDLNVMGGVVKEKLSTVNLAAAYPDALNTRISGLKFNNGTSHSIDAEAGYYIDDAGHYGIGTGLMYMWQNGNATLDNFHVEYKSVDRFNNVFRQVVTSDGQIKEQLHTSSLNIPLLLKYKKRFSTLVGFTADAGVLFNILEQTRYNTNAAFDYEAIYQYTNGQGNATTYDFLASPAAKDLLITRSQYLATHSAATINSYFGTLQSEGYNVGMGMKPANRTGRVSDVTGSAGLLLRPAASIFLRENVTINVGVYYLYQDFKHNAPSDYRITDKLGQYNALINGVNNTAGNSYGMTVGATYRFCPSHPGMVMPPVEDTSSVPESDLIDNSGTSVVFPAASQEMKSSTAAQGEAAEARETLYSKEAINKKTF